MPTFVHNINSQYRAELIFTQLYQEVSNNRSRVRRTLQVEKLSGDGFRTFSPVAWSLTGGGNESGTWLYDFADYKVKKIFEDEIWVNHDADGGRSFSVSASVSMASPPGGTGTPAGTVTLTTIPRATQPSVGGPLTIQADGGTIEISMPRASSSFRHRLRYSFGNRTGPIAENVGVSFRWTVDTTLLSEIPSATTGVGNIICDTLDADGRRIGQKTVPFRVNAGSEIVPTIGGINLSEAVPEVASAVGAYVQGQTRLNFAVTGAAGAAWSTIQGYAVTVAGQTHEAASGVTAPVGASGVVTVTAKVTDSRGRTATRTQNINVLPWAAPKVSSLKVERANADGLPQDTGTYLRVTVVATVSPLLVAAVQKNALGWRFGTQTKGTTEWAMSAWTVHGDVTMSAWFVVGGNYSDLLAYDALFEVRDIFTQTNPSAAATVVAVGQVLLEFTRDGVGVGKRWERGALDVGGDAYVSGVVSPGNPLLIGYNKGLTSVPSGQWVALNTSFGSGVTILNNGFIFGSGKIDVPRPGIYSVAASVRFPSSVDGGDRLLRIRSVGETVDFGSTWMRLNGGSPYAPSGQKLSAPGLARITTAVVIEVFHNIGNTQTVELENISLAFLREIA